jgi:diguanylate cyclase (GGDEF)-like protein
MSMAVKCIIFFCELFLVYKIYKLYFSFKKKQNYHLLFVGGIVYVIGSFFDILNRFFPFFQIGSYASDIFHLLGIIILFVGVTRVIKNLVQISYIDSLTQLYNQRYIIEKVDGELMKSFKKSGNLAILFIDVNNFKEINDKLGHEAGNTLLYQIAQTIRKQVRLNDIVGRYGGDEFICVLFNISKEEAKQILERIQKSIMEMDICQKHKVSISGGVSIFPDDGINLKELIKVADKRMYENKYFLKNHQLFC